MNSLPDLWKDKAALMKMQLRGLAAALLLAGILGGLALFISGLLVVLAIAVPVLVILAVLFGKPVIEEEK